MSAEFSKITKLISPVAMFTVSVKLAPEATSIPKSPLLKSLTKSTALAAEITMAIATEDNTMPKIFELNFNLSPS